MTVTLANAPCSWGVDYADEPGNPAPDDVFAGIARAGYRHAELGPYGYAPTDPGALGALLGAHGLGLVGGFLFEPMHDPDAHDAIRLKARALVPLLAAAGGRVLVLIDHTSPGRERTAGRSAEAERLDDARHGAMAMLLDELGTLAADRGVAAVLHHHAASFVEFEDEIERTLGALGDHVGLCVDTGHAAYAGLDPTGLIERWGPRVRHLHLKDIDPAVHARALRERVGFDEAVGRDVFVPLGEGVVDFGAFASALERADYRGHATIEQDISPDPAAPERPVAAARASRAFLASVSDAYAA